MYQISYYDRRTGRALPDSDNAGSIDKLAPDMGGAIAFARCATDASLSRWGVDGAWCEKLPRWVQRAWNCDADGHAAA